MIRQTEYHRRLEARRSARGLLWLLTSAAYGLTMAPLALAEQEGRPTGSATQPTHSSPIAISADDRLVWSVNPDLNTVSVIRTDIGQRIARIPVGKDPRSVALSPDGRHAYVANAADNTVSIIRIAESDLTRFSAVPDASGPGSARLTTGAEPRAVVVSPDSSRVFVANRSQDTISVISAQENRLVGSFDLDNSDCNDANHEHHFQPAALAVTGDGRFLLVTQYISYTSGSGVQRDDLGKEGVVCRLEIGSSSFTGGGLQHPVAIRLAPADTGFLDPNGNRTHAFPNQLQSIVLHGRRAFLANLGASPSGPLNFATDTLPFVNSVGDVEARPSDLGAISLNVGGMVPEAGKLELYFSNPDAMAFTTPSGAGYAYVASGGSDILVKLRVLADESLAFTAGANTTRYIDLNDPDNAATSGANAGKNPIGLAINKAGTRAYTLNYVSRNISVVDLTTDKVVKVIASEDLPPPGSHAEEILIGAEMFFSSRGNFLNPTNMGSSHNRLSEKGHQSCASCHPAGLNDGVVWQFNSGPRKTIALNGTFNRLDPHDQRLINVSAIFDEVADAELNTRLTSGPGLLPIPQPCLATPPQTSVTSSTTDPDHGLILGAPFEFALAPCIVNGFTIPNAGRPSAAVQLPGSNVLWSGLDSIGEWVHFAIRTPNRPLTRAELLAAHADPAGGLDDLEIAAGRRLFGQAGCNNCHSGGMWSISSRKFAPPPPPEDIATESGVPGVNQAQYLWRALVDIGSFGLNVPGSGNPIAGFPQIGGIETDTNGNKALGLDYNGDGKGAGFSPSSLLGTYNVQPYYHNGACETLECVLADATHRRAGEGSRPDMLRGALERKLLLQFLKSLDASTPVF
jgi:YVTN family beta-propeller protein